MTAIQTTRPWARVALLGLLCAAAGCRSETGIRVSVGIDPAIVVDQLKLTVTTTAADVQPVTATVPDQPSSPLPSGTRVLVLLADAWAGREAAVELGAIGNGQLQATGKGSVIVERGKFVDLAIELAKLSCTDTCPAGDSQCVADSVRTCLVGLDGCASWEAPVTCPADKPFCSLGRCGASCQDECPTAGLKRCASPGPAYQPCEKNTSSGCLQWGLPMGCSAKELCQGGDCLPDCGGKPCTCKLGETSSCADVGECRGGQRSCRSDGTFGPCVWQVGPKLEVCDGKDNDCDTKVDNDLVAPACSKQLGVCKGSTQSCGGAAGWTDCDDAAYQAWAQKNGHVYHAAGDLCDGQDSDCNGVVDQGCTCKADCTSKACGADDGCGHPCQTGNCPGAQDQCLSGKCVCQPSCGGSKACGADDGCGTKCQTGSCSNPQATCQSGTCVCQPSCGGSKACGADDGCGTKCQTGNCPTNSSCVVGACACNFVTCGSTCCGAGQLCSTSGTCCTPNCGTRKCGPDPGCGSCGSCPTGFPCGSDGQCLTGPRWSAVPSPVTDPLWAVWGPNASDLWAVGGDGAVLHYNGTSWSLHSRPTTAWLYGVWGTSATSIWAVGSEGTVLHYDGTTWSTVAVSGVGTDVYLYGGLSGSSWQDIWAVGEYSGTAGNFGGLMLHYDGTTWRPLVSGLTTSQLFSLAPRGVWAVDSSTVWLASYASSDGVLQFNGTSWAPSSGAPVSTRGVWVSADGDVWAVGESIGHLYAGSWTNTSTKALGGDTLEGVWGASASRLWAVGFNGTIAYYNGSFWWPVTSPVSVELKRVWGTSADDVWAVGDDGTIVHYH